MEVQYKLDTDRTLVAESVKAILSVILFHRIFGPVTPQTQEVLGLTYPTVKNSAIDVMLEDRMGRLLKSINDSDTGQIGLIFYDHKKVKKQSWFLKPQDDIWERWLITLNIHSKFLRNDEEREASREYTRKQLESIFFKINAFVNENKQHIPPITTTDVSPFPYEVVIPQESDESWGGVIKRILAEGN